MNITIFTDGSHFKNGGSGRLGIGGILLIDGVLKDKFSEEITQDWISQNLGTTDCSNPTMEFLAILFALKNFGPQIKGKEVTFKMDYNGIVYWMDGTWRSKLPYIRQIRDEVKLQISLLKIKPKFVWVKGHQSIMSEDAKWNNEVDKLAKGI